MHDVENRDKSSIGYKYFGKFIKGTHLKGSFCFQNVFVNMRICGHLINNF